MDLQTYLEKHDMPASWIAERAKVSNTTIHNLLKGKDILLSSAMRIEAATKKQVKCKDMLPVEVQNKKRSRSTLKVKVKDKPKAKSQKSNKKIA